MNFDALLDCVEASRLVDLSSDVGEHAKGPFQTELEVLEAEPGASFFCANVLPHLAPHAVGKLRPEDFPDGAFLRHETVRASVHAGSHVDAPGHYGPLEDGSKGYINDAPLEAFIGAGVRIDVSTVTDARIGLRHIESAGGTALVASGRQTIVLIETGGNKGIDAEVIEAFLDVGVRVIGTDGESFDGPFQPMVDRFVETGDPSVLWPAHVIGRRRPYYQLERLRNLDMLPQQDFVVIAMPVLIDGATAAWTRAVALVH